MWRFRSQEVFFVVLLIIITLLTTSDLISDYLEGTEAWHLSIEALVVLMSVGGIAYLLQAFIKRQRELDAIKAQLAQTKDDLSEARQQISAAGQAYSQVIQKQFETWQLTPSEKEVASLLLKGLSFDEIANVRNTKEKTVRQQATAIYRKSGLSSRHEFAAWFFEDFL
ncbi:regulatory protein, luxR family [Thiothrix eikelboomii]|uniref:Regulatory protein, luxR family n=1 Tax=Thiothrix eikelboomii TaxID=92487 RepID=A0A1T4WIY7_9GAMM|nr:helix-turn-helix transcriptional regulator [Thiothrix eikelboomii]SKA77304.1 regulatory protein, luxR family [Thiothrix eikelboomii]